MCRCLAGILFFCSSPLLRSAVSLPTHDIRDTISEAEILPLALWPQQPRLNFDLAGSLPSAPSRTHIQHLSLPENCTAYDSAKEFSGSAEMTAVNVQFEDCDDAFTVCRCNDATMSMDTVVQRLGSVPVGLRRYARLVVVLNGNGTDPHAYTLTNGDIHLFGDCEMDTWVHEMVHAFDFAAGVPQSDAMGWRAALRADTCVPHNYALTNAIEDFAQVGVVKAYMALHGGSLPPGLISDCMTNQLAFMDKLALYDPVTLFGNTCAIKEDWPPARQTAMLDTTRTFQIVPSENPTPTVDPGSKNAGTTARENGAGASLDFPPRALLPLIMMSLASSAIFAVLSY